MHLSVSASKFSLPSCPPVFFSSDLTHPFTSPPLKGGEKEYSHHPSPIGEGATHVDMLDNSNQLLSCIREGYTPSCHCEEGVCPTSQSQNSCNMNVITTQTAFARNDSYNEITTSNAPHSPRNDKLSSRFTLHPSLIEKAAFTLAEVLITLGIISVVAAMTVPSLIQKHQEKELAVRVRKVYSDISNALLLSQKEFDGNIDYSSIFNPNNTSYETAQAFAEYFNGSKVCKNTGECPNAYHELKYSKYQASGTGQGVATTLANYPCIILNNGAMLYIQQYDHPNCYAIDSYEKWDEDGNPVYDSSGNPIIATSENTMCGFIYIDVNGVKRPNRFGQDAYRIGVSKTKVLPNAQPYQGKESLENILSGNDKFVYEDYTVGKPKE